MADTDAELLEIAGWLREAERIVVLTGAGISTESGIQDFRGPQGLWTKNPGAEKMATLQNYVAEPETRRRAWRNRLESPVWRAEPNEGHRALVRLEQSGRLHLLITQNVDGLHAAAGTSKERSVASISRMRSIAKVRSSPDRWSCPIA